MRKTKNNYVPAEYGGYMFPKSCLPDILPGDRGKVLTVNQSETEAIWAQAQGGNGAMLVHVTDDVLDKTWQEITDALSSGQICLIHEVYEDGIGAALMPIGGTTVESGNYEVYVWDASYSTTSPNGYPVLN